MNFLRLITLICLVAVIGSVQPTYGQKLRNWADNSADISVSEFLDLYFEIELRQHGENDLNAYNLVGFYPSEKPSTAIVVVIQTWHDDRLAQSDLRREIRKFADAMIGEFDATVRSPIVRRRWNVTEPKSNILIRHVRFSDPRETLAVTMSGITYFDDESFKRAEALLKGRGAVWSW